MILLNGTQPILVDSGFGSDIEETIALLHSINIHPQDLQMIVNTHWHCDHNGGNHHFQSKYQIPIAAHPSEAEIINRGQESACDANWLVQPIEQYKVDILLKEGDILDTGSREWQVIETPGHSRGHLSFFSDGILIAGDTVHADDIAWLNTMLYGQDCIQAMMQSLDKLARLRPKISYSGHGTVTGQAIQQIDAMRRRLERWIEKPQSIAWHAMKRIFAYHLMLHDGLNETDIRSYLLLAPWFNDYTTQVFESNPSDFMPSLLEEMLRSNAAVWKDDLLMPTAPYLAPNPEWLKCVISERWTQ